jgi:hypothetical protein
VATGIRGAVTRAHIGAILCSVAEKLPGYATMRRSGVSLVNTRFETKAPSFPGDAIHVERDIVKSRRGAGRPDRPLGQR